MDRLRTIVCVIVISLLCQVYESLKVYDRLVYERRIGSFIQYLFRDGRLLYTACDGNKNEFKCSVSREKTAYLNDSYLCEFSLKSEQDNGTINFRTYLDVFGKDKVLVGWEDNGENKYIKYSIINLSSCKTAETKLIAQKNQSLVDYQVLFYGDTYHVIFKNHILCGEKLCKITVNAEGKVVSGPESYFENNGNPRFFAAENSDSSMKRYSFIRRKNGHHQTSYHLVKPDGSTKTLTRVKNMLFPFHISTSHNLFGICYTIQLSSMFDTETKCAQYNYEGILKFEITMKDLNKTTMMKHMHNLRQGGFIVIHEDYANCEPDRCAVSFVAEKRNAEGKYVSSLSLGQRCDDPKARAWTSLFENEDNDYCLAWTCRNDGVEQIYVTVKCLNDTDFS